MKSRARSISEMFNLYNFLILTIDNDRFEDWCIHFKFLSLMQIGQINAVVFYF
jgi:hypothetical protein